VVKGDSRGGKANSIEWMEKEWMQKTKVINGGRLERITMTLYPIIISIRNVGGDVLHSPFYSNSCTQTHLYFRENIKPHFSTHRDFENKNKG